MGFRHEGPTAGVDWARPSWWDGLDFPRPGRGDVVRAARAT